MNHKALCTRREITEKDLEETLESTTTTACGAYIMDIGFRGDSVELNMTVSTCLIWYGKVGLWLADESKRPGSRVTMDEESNSYADQGVLCGDVPESGRDRLRCATGILSLRLLLSMDGMTTTIEGIGSITPITEVRFEDSVGIRKKCVMLEKGFWNMAIWLSY